MADTTPITVHIPPKGFHQLESLSTHATRLPEILQIVNGFRLDDTDAKMIDTVVDRTGIDRTATRRILSGLATLSTMLDGTVADANELYNAITRSVTDIAPTLWVHRNLKKLEEAREPIVAALRAMPPDHPLRMRQKARELTYAHQNIFKSTRIITDLRPVFDAAGGEIVAMVLTHVMSIEYFDGVRMQQIEFALDESDVTSVRNAAARAEVKTKTTRKYFPKEQWKLIVAGDAVLDSDRSE